MYAFRLSKCKYIQDLSGLGAQLYGGRWNSKGRPVVYTAESQALALLETLVHIPQKNLPKDFCLAAIYIPDNISILKMTSENLPDNWQGIPINHFLQSIGDNWLDDGKYPILQVPSVILPNEFNYLINPLHVDAKKIKIKNFQPFIFDSRLGVG